MIWQKTMNLRFVRREVPVEGVQSLIGMASGSRLMARQRVRFLQQAWISDTGEVEWRDVEEVSDE